MTKHAIWMSGNVKKRQANCDIGAFQRISDVPHVTKRYVFLGFWAHGQFTVVSPLSKPYVFLGFWAHGQFTVVSPLSKPYVFLGFWAHGQFTVVTHVTKPYVFLGFWAHEHEINQNTGLLDGFLNGRKLHKVIVSCRILHFWNVTNVTDGMSPNVMFS
jgi:arginyl-tRNA--protein-N-Asp/Glu arginylyltransferase